MMFRRFTFAEYMRANGWHRYAKLSLSAFTRNRRNWRKLTRYL